MTTALPDAIAARYALTTRTVAGRPLRVFADNVGCLAAWMDHLTDHADAELVVMGDQRLTYRDVRQRAARVAAHLDQQHGIAAGDRVGIALDNSPEWMVAFVALAAMGAVPVLINARASDDELRHCLESVQCKLWFCGERPADGQRATAVDATEMAAVCAADAECALPRVERDSDDEAILMFTSGTTGRAKAAVLSHIGVMTSLKTIEYSSVLIAAQMAERYGIDVETLMTMRPPPVTLLMFPLFHVSGCHAVFLTALGQGGKLVLLRRWNPERALELIAAEKITAFPGVPTMHWDVLGLPNRGDFDTSSLTSVSVGGQGTPPALLRAISEAFPQAVLGTGYGMTETNGTVTLAVGDEFVADPTIVGQATATFDLDLRDEDHRAVAAGDTGEVWVRGAGVMSGYANAEDSAIDPDGWFATGDLGVLDADGRLSIVGRSTDMVISGGENIYCAEVERVLDEHPAVRECAAFGIPDDRFGEALVASVLLEGDADARLLADWCAEQLAKYKVPKAFELVSEPLPRNPSGKIIKRAVRGAYMSGRGIEESGR